MNSKNTAFLKKAAERPLEILKTISKIYLFLWLSIFKLKIFLKFCNIFMVKIYKI